LATAWRDLDQNDWNAADLDAAYRLVHSLAGAAETFGFSDLGQAARALNDYLHGLVEQPDQIAGGRAKATMLYGDLALALAAET